MRCSLGISSSFPKQPEALKTLDIFELQNEGARGVPGASPEPGFWPHITYTCSPDTKNVPALPDRSLKIPFSWTRPWALKPRIAASPKAEAAHGPTLPWSRTTSGFPLPTWIFLHFSFSLPLLCLNTEGGDTVCTRMYQYVPVWVTREAGEGWKFQPLCPDPRQPLGHLWSLSR